MAYRMYGQQQNLKAAGGRPIMVAFHHPPDPQCPSTGCQLRNADQVLALLKKYSGVKALINGHTHNAVDEKIGSLMMYTSPSTFAQVTHAQLGADVDHEDFFAAHTFDKQSHGFRVLDLSPDGNIISEIHWA